MPWDQGMSNILKKPAELRVDRGLKNKRSVMCNKRDTTDLETCIWRSIVLNILKTTNYPVCFFLIRLLKFFCNEF